MLGWGTADFFAKKAIDEIGDIVSLVWAHLAGAGLLVAFAGGAYLAGWPILTLPATASAWGALAFFGALQAAVYLFVYVGFGKGQISVLNPIFASYCGLVALFSLAFLGEAVTWHNGIALAVLFTGILLINLDMDAFAQRRLRLTAVPGFPQIAIATLLAAAWTLGWNSFVSERNGLSFALWMYLAMTAALLAYAAVRGVPLAFHRRPVWKFLVLIGFCEALGYVAISLGYAETRHTSIVALLSGAFSLPTLLLARLFLKERISALQVLGGLSIVGAIALLAWS